MVSSPAMRMSPEHLHPAGETCPFCEQPIPNDRAEEIRARYDLKQRQDEAAMKSRVAQQVTEARTELEAEKKAAVEKLQQENAAALGKVTAAALAREAGAREQGKKNAETEAQLKLDALQAAQMATNLKLQEVEQQKATAEKRLATVKAEQDTILAARSAEMRTALEKHKADEINALNAKHVEETQKLSDQMKTMQRQLEVEEGEGADIKLIDLLKKAFPKDDITAIKKPQGADIMHVVIHNKKPCGKIVYDSRNRNLWQSNFASKLREDMVTAAATHAILTTSKFPAGVRQIHLCEGVIVAGLARVAVLAEVLREVIVSNYTQRVSQQDRDLKTAKLYDFIASDNFDKVLGSLAGNDEKLLELDEDEQKTHKKVWEKRRVLTTTSQKLHGKLRADVDRIIGTGESE
jgi:hypothetical protein